MLPTVTTKIIKGLKFSFFDVEEVISDQIMSIGEWNQENVTYTSMILTEMFSKKNINTGTVLDIGSGFGTFSISLARNSKLELKVHAFEAQRPIFYQLCSNALHNSLSNLFAKNVAIGSVNKIEKRNCLNVSRSCNHGSFSLIQEINDIRGIAKFEDDPVEDIEFKTIDGNYNFDDVVFIKISVCGMESEVLSGMRDTIIQNHNPPIMIESWKSDFNIQTHEMCLSLLKEFGYFAYAEKNDFIYAVSKEDQEYLSFFDEVESIKF